MQLSLTPRHSTDETVHGPTGNAAPGPQSGPGGLQRERDRLIAVLEMTSDLVGIGDRTGHVQYLNPAGRRLLGIGPDEDLSHTMVSDYYSARDGSNEFLEMLRRGIELGTWTGDRALLHRDGTEIPVSQTVTIHRDNAGEIHFISTIARDIREYRRVHDRLQLREQVLDAITEGIVVTAPWRVSNPIIYVNPAFERITGYQSHEVIGRSPRLLAGPTTNLTAIEEICAAIDEQRPLKREVQIQRADGAPLWTVISISPLHDDKGRLLYFVAVISDESERHKLEQQMRESQKMEAIGRLAGALAHDFNNVLTIMMGSAECAQGVIAPGHRELLDYMDTIREAGARAAALTRQLLVFSRQQVLEPRLVNVNSAIERIARLIRRLLGEDVACTCSLAADPACILIDESQFEQVFVNLAVNARHAMPQGGAFTITTSNFVVDDKELAPYPGLQSGIYVRIDVGDTGCGMPPEVVSRAFEPFFTTKKLGEGTGLGLSTVRGIVQQSNGHISVCSEVGRGTTFHIDLPCTLQGEMPGEVADHQEQCCRGTETVLLVEDEQAILELARAFLEGCGYTVLAAENGASACRIAVTHAGPIHILVTDIVMPGMGGSDVAQEVTALRPETRTLYVSGYTDDAVVCRGIREHEVNLLRKPYNRESLTRRVREVLDAAASLA